MVPEVRRGFLHLSIDGIQVAACPGARREGVKIDGSTVNESQIATILAKTLNWLKQG